MNDQKSMSVESVKTNRESNSYRAYDWVVNKSVRYVCQKCKRDEYEATINANSFIDVTTNSIGDKSVIRDLINTAYIDLDSVKLFCPRCNYVTHHIGIDRNIYDVYKILNDKGYRTLFSCEGHVGMLTDIRIKAIDTYIMIEGKDHMHLFDMGNELLTNWYILDNFGDDDQFALYLDGSKTTVDEFMENEHIQNLMTYIKRFIPDNAQ